MNKSEQINELATALSKAQGAIKGAVKDSANPFFKNSYADLSSVWDACRNQLTFHGLSVVQTPCLVDAGIGLETMLMHSSGQWISNQFTMPVSKPDAQGVGSAITYARRYALAAMVGVAPEDDDGNAAMGKTGPKINHVTGEIKPSRITPNSGAGETLTVGRKKDIENIADEVKASLSQNLNVAAVSIIRDYKLEIEEKNYLWSLLDSKQRAVISNLTKS